MASVLFTRPTGLNGKLRRLIYGVHAAIDCALAVRTCGLDLVIVVGRGGEPLVSPRPLFLRNHVVVTEFILPLGYEAPPELQRAMADVKSVEDPTCAAITRLMKSRGRTPWVHYEPSTMGPVDVLRACLESDLVHVDNRSP